MCEEAGSVSPDNTRKKSLRAAYRNAVLHLALFVPWERFLDSPADDIPRLWRSFEADLSDRIRSYVRNIALLRVSTDDARADRKLRGFDQDF